MLCRSAFRHFALLHRGGCNRSRLIVHRLCSSNSNIETTSKFGRIYKRQDNGRWQAHNVSGKYCGQFDSVQEAEQALKSQSVQATLVKNLSPSDESPADRPDKITPDGRERIRNSDGFLEFDEVEPPWRDPHGIRDKQPRMEKLLDDTNYIMRKSKGAYWVVAGISFIAVGGGMLGLWK
eukprot:g4644.t1